MLIDWFTVGAQTLNFLILVWLMKRYLYQPVLQAIDAREKLIAAQLADADARKIEADRQCEEFRQRNGEFDRQRASLMLKVSLEAKVERQRLLDEARSAADSLRAKQDEILRSDATSLNESIVRRTRAEVFAIARKTLKELAGAGLEAQAAAVFADRLRAMEAPAKGKLAEALKESAEPALMRSAFELPVEQRASLRQAINETFSADVPLRFETAPDMVAGIELSSGGRKVAWSIADYLDNLESNVSDLSAKPPVSGKAAEAIPL
jgi:F-type H+-transporting ATPase subunit b